MSKTIEYKIKVDAGSSVKTLGQLEQELASINEELKDIEVGSTKFNELTKSAQNATKEITKINKQIEGITGEDKIRGLDGSIKILAGSTQALVGGLGLLGIESEKFGEFEKKAASAIAFGIGLKDVGEGVAQLGQFIGKLPGPTKIATIAQKAFNAVLRANPIGLVVTAIGLVVAGFVLFSDKVKSVIKSIEPLNNILQKTVGFFRSVGQAIGLVASEEEIATKKVTEATNQRIKDLDREIKVRKAAGEETVALERQRLNELLSLTQLGSQEQKDAIADLEAFEAGVRKKAADDAERIEKEKNDKVKAERQKDIDDLKVKLQKQQDILNGYREQERDLDIVFEEERLALELEREFKRIEQAGFVGEERRKAEEAAIRIYNTKLQQLEEQQLLENAEKKKEILAQIQEAEVSSVEEERALAIEKTTEYYDTLIAKAAEYGLSTIELEKAKAAAIGIIQEESLMDEQAILDAKLAAQLAYANAIGAAIGALGGLFEQGTAAAKAAAIAEIAIGTGVGYVNALDIAQKSAKGTGPAAAFAFPIFYATQIAAVLGAVGKAKNILSTVKGGGGVGGGINAPSIPRSGGGVPSTPTVSTPGIQDIAAQTTIEQAQTREPLMAYVLEGSVTSAQEASAKIRQRRTVGR
jgi:hypothetical protein